MYLNQVPYGGSSYGIEEASKTYFNKSAKDLTLSEAAYLAALPKAPSYFSPWGAQRTELNKRHDLVLEKIVDLINDLMRRLELVGITIDAQ